MLPEFDWSPAARALLGDLGVGEATPNAVAALVAARHRTLLIDGGDGEGDESGGGDGGDGGPGKAASAAKLVDEVSF